MSGLLAAVIALAPEHHPHAEALLSDINEAVALFALLPPRQAQTLRCLVQGKRIPEIAQEMGLSTRTAETHRYLAIKCLGVGTLAEALRICVLGDRDGYEPVVSTAAPIHQEAAHNLRDRDQSPDLISVGDITFDPRSNTLRVGLGDLVEMPRAQGSILGFLMRHPGKTMSRARIFMAIYGGQGGRTDTLLVTYICLIRSHLRKAGAPNAICTMRGYGWSFVRPQAHPTS